MSTCPSHPAGECIEVLGRPCTTVLEPGFETINPYRHVSGGYMVKPATPLPFRDLLLDMARTAYALRHGQTEARTEALQVADQAS